MHAVIDEVMGRWDDEGREEGGGDPNEQLYGVLFLCEPFVELPPHLQPSPVAPAK